MGEGILHYRLLRDHSKLVKCIGMTMWSTISEEARRELKENSKVGEICRLNDRG